MNFQKFSKKLYLAIYILFLSILSYSQESFTTQNIDQDDPKVGLVLSGGGAKGLAHIGALKIIEEAGIRIDYIGGTSMGAIIGSLYSAGYSPKELDSIFRSFDYDAFIQDEIPRESMTFYEKEDVEKYAVTLPFDNFSIGLPKGLSKGQNFFNEYSRFTAHINHISDFSQMPIPFFCMATDISNGKPVLMDKGYLPLAVSASGALPSIFDPVDVGGILMTDGGVANNYPVEEIRKKGAEIIIGVDVQDSLLSTDQIKSAMDIMQQISTFSTIKEMKNKINQTDVYIKPSIEGFTIVSFDKKDEIIRNGELAAIENIEALKKIAARQKKGVSRKSIPRKSDTLLIKSLNMVGNKRYSRSYIKGKLKLRKTPKLTTFQELNEGINNITATRNFDRVGYKLISTPDGEDLILRLHENPNRMLLRFAMHYDDLYRTAGLVNLTRKRLLFDDDIFTIDVALGDNVRTNVDYYIDRGYYWSIGFKSNYTEFEKNLDIGFINRFGDFSDLDINQVGIDYKNFDIQFYLETLLKQTFSVDLGVEYKRLSIISETFGQDVDMIPRTVFDNSDYWSAFGYIKYDSYDHKYFPRDGFLFRGDVHGYLFSSDTNNFSEFSIAKAKFGHASPLTKALAIESEIEAGTIIGNTGTRSLDFSLGGFGARMINNFIPFYGYDFLDISGGSFAKVMVNFDYKFLKKNHVNISANFANVGDKLFSTGNWLQVPEYTGYAIGYGLETFAGPAQVKYSYSPELKQDQWFFSLGFWF